MTSLKRPLRLAILGVRGIGQVHARILKKLGAEVCAVLGSSDESAEKAVRDLDTSLGIQAKPFSCLNSILSLPLDAVCVCTPPQMHFAHVMAALDRNLSVFCEKPLFWDAHSDLTGILKKLTAMERHPNRRLFVNTSNTVFIDAIRDKLPAVEKFESFYFRFHTQGPHSGDDIAVDLFPHGLSILLRLFGVQELTGMCYEVTDTSCQCTFKYGHCSINFDFQQNLSGSKQFRFRANDCEFERIQEGRGASYRVYLSNTKTEERVEVDDPFCVYTTRFLQSCRDAAPVWEDEARDAIANLRLMAQTLIPKEKLV